MNRTINEYEFVKAFDDMNRGNNFSTEGRRALYEYITEYEEEIGAEISLDVIALCCEYSEYKNIKEFQHDYNEEYETIEDIQKDTQVIMIDDESFIIQQF